MTDLDDRSDDSTPITILTGFLGAGKTTLLNRILVGDHGLRVAVLVNDFGALNIDADLVIGVEDDVISLENGCVCCGIRDDLVDTVRRVLDRPEAPEYLLLEASGVADPAGIAMTFVDSDLRERVRLDSIICVVDAGQVFAHPELPALMNLKLRQVGFSDLVIVNKIDQAGPAELAEVRAWLETAFRRLRIIETSQCDVPLDILLAVGRFEPAQLDLSPDVRAQTRAQAHEQVFSTWSFETERPMSLVALREAARGLPGSVYRAKGIIRTSETPDRRAVLHVVGRRVDIAIGERWGLTPALSRIVVIGARDGLDEGLLTETFTACLSGMVR